MKTPHTSLPPPRLHHARSDSLFSTKIQGTRTRHRWELVSQSPILNLAQGWPTAGFVNAELFVLKQEVLFKQQ